MFHKNQLQVMLCKGTPVYKINEIEGVISINHIFEENYIIIVVPELLEVIKEKIKCLDGVQSCENISVRRLIK